MGYAAPEYGLGNEVSTYGDVYSYGVLLLEMFTGRKPTDNMFKDGFTLHDFAKAGLQEQVIDILILFYFQKEKMRKQGEIMCPIKVKKKSQNQRMPEFATGSWSGLFRGNSKGKDEYG
ncbi:hypothetical protein CJ030_MR4G010901 [Morella rubra]|uniref:Protein kinase domain-containing protein n=1 Tax=Morella rubra TaxID=262757 RepID=A0A6A1VSJ9_9ROSI|nr:hypothetical protein CJ030_MR4G010901 [Morella rubra]